MFEKHRNTFRIREIKEDKDKFQHKKVGNKKCEIRRKKCKEKIGRVKKSKHQKKTEAKNGKRWMDLKIEKREEIVLNEDSNILVMNHDNEVAYVSRNEENEKYDYFWIPDPYGDEYYENIQENNLDDTTDYDISCDDNKNPKDIPREEENTAKKFEIPISKEDYIFWQGYDELAPKFRDIKDRNDLPLHYYKDMWERSVDLGYEGPAEFHDFVVENINNIKMQIKQEEREKDEADFKWQTEEAERFRIDLAKVRIKEVPDEMGLMPENVKHKDKIKAAALERKKIKDEKKKSKPKVTPEERRGVEPKNENKTPKPTIAEHGNTKPRKGRSKAQHDKADKKEGKGSKGRNGNNTTASQDEKKGRKRGREKDEVDAPASKEKIKRKKM